MRRSVLSVVFLGLIALAAWCIWPPDVSRSGPAQTQDRGITGKWAGTAINDAGIRCEDSLEITENEDGTLTGYAGPWRLKIENGERVTADVLQWEHATQTHRWRVRCTVRGKSLVLDYTCTSRENGKVKGGTGTSVLTKLAPITYVPDPASKKELANWQGTWKGTEALLTIDGAKWTWTDLQGKPHDGGTIRILGVHEKIIKADLVHETGDQPRADLTLAIFRVEGDTLFYNGAYPPNSRPTAFKAVPGWQRVKKQVLNGELEKMQGTWKLFSFETEGAQVGDRDKRETFTIKGDTWIVKVGEDIESGVIKVVKAPDCFDLVRTGEKYRGLTTQAIFHVDGDTMKYCARGRDDQALGRPTSFTTKPGDRTFLAIYKRVTETPDVEAIEKVVRSYLEHQCKPSMCEQNIGLCLEDAVHSVVWKSEGKVNRATVREVVAFAKKTFSEDMPTTVESVKVEVHGKTGLAVAFVQFNSVGVSCHDVITLALRDGTWKIVSIVQQNLEPK